MKLSIFYEHILEAVDQSHKTLSEILDIVKQSGIDYVEMDCLRLYADGDSIFAALNKAEIEISCIYKTFDFANSTDATEGIELIDMAVKYGCQRILIVPGFSDYFNDALYDNAAIPINAMCEYGNKLGVSMVMEDYDNERSLCANSEGMREFLKRVPGLSIAFDTGNFIYSDEDVNEAYEVLKDRITHAHFKDRSDVPNEGGICVTVTGTKLYPCAVGEGIIPIEGIFNKLKNDGFDGIIALEHFGHYNQLDAIVKSAEYVKGLIND